MSLNCLKKPLGKSCSSLSNVKYLQDGIRLSEAERNLLDLSHRQVLTDYNIDIVEISGNWEQRFQKAGEQINKQIIASGQKHLSLVF